MQFEPRFCSQHPLCEGPDLAEGHDQTCPFKNGADCDNDQCWKPCAFCISETDVN